MQMKKVVLAAVVAGAVVALSVPAMTTAAKGKPAEKLANDGRAKCYECHEEIKAMKEGSKHAKLACKTCHDNLDKHMESMGETKPVTIIDQALCGKCHKNQYDSFYKVSSEGGARKEKGIPTGRSPQQDKLLARTASPSSITSRAAMPSWSPTSSLSIVSRVAAISIKTAGRM